MMEGFGGNSFDHVFGSKSTLHAADGSKLSSYDSRVNSFNGYDLTDNGRQVVSTMGNQSTNGHHTFSNGMMVSSTSTDSSGDTHIRGSVGEDIGTIKDSFFGEGKDLYVGSKKMATSEIDISGNKKILLLEDPLTKAHEYALMELVLSK